MMLHLEGMSSQTSLSPADIRALAVVAEVAEATARRWLEGREVRQLSVMRLCRAARRLGHALPSGIARVVVRESDVAPPPVAVLDREPEAIK